MSGIGPGVDSRKVFTTKKRLQDLEKKRKEASVFWGKPRCEKEVFIGQPSLTKIRGSHILLGKNVQ